MSPRSVAAKAAPALMAIAALAVSACGSSGGGGSSSGGNAGGELSGKVFYLTPGSQAVRYLRFDAPNMKTAFAKRAPGLQFQALDAGQDAGKQLAQAETAIASGAKAIIISSVDPKQAAGVLAKAAAANIPVISYAPESFGGPLYAHVSVPFSQIGDAQGRYFAEHLPKVNGPVRLAEIYGDPGFDFYTQLKRGFDKHINPLIQQGKVKVVCKADSRAWSPANSESAMEQCLTKTNNGVDAALAMNDDTGGGVLAAARRENLDKRIKLYGGYDATIDAVRRVVAGQQAATMTPPYKQMADTAAQLAIAAIRNQPPPKKLINGTFDNQFKKTVPAAYIPNVFITADNVQKTVVDAGIYTRKDICQGVAASSSYCKGGAA
jgi:D-xylose transport system substrate-binding protein